MRRDKPSDQLRLLHIRDAAQLAIEFVQGLDYDQFINDAKTYAATVRQIEVIGEAVYNLTSEFKSLHSHIEWSKIEKTRHILYFAPPGFVHGEFPKSAKYNAAGSMVCQKPSDARYNS